MTQASTVVKPKMQRSCDETLEATKNSFLENQSNKPEESQQPSINLKAIEDLL
jgi:hypothetical protein